MDRRTDDQRSTPRDLTVICDTGNVFRSEPISVEASGRWYHDSTELDVHHVGGAMEGIGDGERTVRPTLEVRYDARNQRVLFFLASHRMDRIRAWQR